MGGTLSGGSGSAGAVAAGADPGGAAGELGAVGIGKFGIRSVLRWLAGGNGVEQALTVLYQREEDFVWRWLHRLGVPDRDVDDVLITVFLRMHAYMHKEGVPTEAHGLLGDMATKEALSYHRAARRGLQTVLGDPISERPDSQQNPERAMLRAWGSDIIATAFGQMDPADAKLVQQVDFDGEDTTTSRSPSASNPRPCTPGSCGHATTSRRG